MLRLICMLPGINLFVLFQIMLDSDTDSSGSGGLRRVFSLTEESFDTVPHTTDYKMKFRAGSKKARLLYTLKANLPLPYSTQLEGFFYISEI